MYAAAVITLAFGLAVVLVVIAAMGAQHL